MSRPLPPSDKTKNWPAYSEALKQRASLTIWFDPDMVWVPPPTGNRGRQPQYSDAAIQACLTMKGEGRLGIDPGDQPSDSIQAISTKKSPAREKARANRTTS